MDREVRRFLRKCLTEHFLTSETRKFIEASARLQKEWGRAGVFPSSSMADDIDPEGIWYALGLVDCTIYMRVSIRVPLSVANERLDLPALFESCKDDVRIECKVGDLDPKVGTGAQGVFFKNQERSLSRGGWYFGEEGTRSCRDGRRIERK
ncbi:hypothetical protein BJ508DRAFT_410432 [Ascobolus immersus RN42]|uniref:Uncharacterized protein n=1 Tax=Ascobolus immersus RN42 TaxID=1160509 RepID=A0A3N4IU10_ASCIM|nr:hypothetical protein BJ508DRAFT_410432 [Ascobolus immersus RN42]